MKNGKLIIIIQIMSILMYVFILIHRTNFVDLYGKITPNRYGWGTYVHTLMASVVLERPVFVLMIGEELRVLEYSLDPKICVSASLFSPLPFT